MLKAPSFTEVPDDSYHADEPTVLDQRPDPMEMAEQAALSAMRDLLTMGVPAAAIHVISREAIRMHTEAQTPAPVLPPGFDPFA